MFVQRYLTLKKEIKLHLFKTEVLGTIFGPKRDKNRATAVSRRPLTAEARVRARVNPCEICCGGQIGTGTGFSPSYSGLPCQYRSTVAPYSYIIWEMNIRPVGSRSSETQPQVTDIRDSMNMNKKDGILSTDHDKIPERNSIYALMSCC
jgi:hypothetical protein